MAYRPERRTVVGAVVLAAAVAGTLTVSPARATALATRVAGDPLLLGLVLAALYCVRPLFAWPTTLLSLLVGAGFGVAVGVPLALVGIAVTTLPTFLATDYFAVGDRLPRAERIGTEYFDRVGALRGVIAGRLVPVPSDVLTCGAAVAGVRLRTMLVGTVVGEVPWTVAAVVVGASAERVATTGLDGLGLRLGVLTTLAGLLLLVGPAYAALYGDTLEADADPGGGDT